MFKQFFSCVRKMFNLHFFWTLQNSSRFCVLQLPQLRTFIGSDLRVGLAFCPQMCSAADSPIWFSMCICCQAPGPGPRQNLELVEVHQHQGPAVFIDPICSPLTFQCCIMPVSSSSQPAAHLLLLSCLNAGSLTSHRGRGRWGRTNRKGFIPAKHDESQRFRQTGRL